MGQKEVERMPKSMILRSGLRQFRIMKELRQDMMQTVCCLGQKHTQRFDGSEMNWELLEKIHGLNQR